METTNFHILQVEFFYRNIADFDKDHPVAHSDTHKKKAKGYMVALTSPKLYNLYPKFV